MTKDGYYSNSDVGRFESPCQKTIVEVSDIATINLYRIDEEKVQQFIQELSQKMQLRNTVVRNLHTENEKPERFDLSLYMSRVLDDKKLTWNWLLTEFNQPTVEVASAPKAVVLVETGVGNVYAATFGHSFFLVDKYCDRDFGFSFARKLAYKEIKTTTLTTPSSRRNKTVNTYVNYSELEFDSGESFAKLKANVDVPEEFPLYKSSIEIGSSIKFSTNQEDLEVILELIVHVENVLRTQSDRCQIPVFSKVSDSALVQCLNDSLTENIRRDPAQVNIAELDIVGATEIFNHNDCEFDLKYRQHKIHCQSLSNDVIRDFCTQFSLSYSDVVLDISVVCYCNGTPVVTKKVKDLIDYTDDEKRCILSKGVWYKYNTDYLNYLRDSLCEIKAEYHPEYDFNGAIHDAFVDERYIAEMNRPEYAGKPADAVKQLLKRRYYAERAFNLIRAQKDGFTNFDREPQRIGAALVEQMDLYKDGFMYSVKLGNSSAKLCYAVDQSLTALKAYKKDLLPDCPSIHTAVLWFVLDRAGHIEDASGNPDINQLEMLMLKNRLDQWKKEVRLMGYQPLIYVNYRNN